MKTEYPLIPMSDIRPEVRDISVAWHEGATNWIGDKHKLASDIQNYADNYAAMYANQWNSPLEPPDTMRYVIVQLNGITSNVPLYWSEIEKQWVDCYYFVGENYIVYDNVTAWLDFPQ